MTTALALGIPGDSSTAVLLGALTMYGMVTGPTLLSKSSDFVCRLYIIMLLANIIILPLGLLSAKVCIKLLSVKNEYIQMAVLLICCIGAYSLGPLVLGLLLGGMCETNLRRTLMLSGGSLMRLFTTPISMLLVGLILLAIGWPVISEFKGRKKKS